MKKGNKAIVIAAIFMSCLTFVVGQTKLNVGAAYYIENLEGYGANVEFEIDRHINEKLALPIRTSFGFFARPNYHAFFVDEQFGFRRLLANGFFFEQYIGIGLIAKKYKPHLFYYEFDTGSGISHGNQLIYGVMPSIAIGGGKTFTKSKNHKLWFRPKIYWDFSFRGLDRPYAAIQLGYSYTIR